MLHLISYPICTTEWCWMDFTYYGCLCR